MAAMHAESERLVQDLSAFLDASPSPWHAGAEVMARLERAGFERLDEGVSWDLEPGARVYVEREGSSVLAFRLGLEPPSHAGYRLLLAHTDSPCLRVKPAGFREAPGGQRALLVEVYGGALLHTWLDRDLGLAGRVAVRGGRGIVLRRWRSEGAVARISSLAIHLHRAVNSEGLKLDAQRHMTPLVGGWDGSGRSMAAWLAAALHPACAPEDVLGWDLCLHDVVGAARLGLEGEYLASGRLDNLASCHAVLQALLDVPEGLAHTVGIVLFDHEEVGSRTARGADSPFLERVLERIGRSMEDRFDAVDRALARSRVVSVDMAHALHPAWPERHEPDHRPRLGGGPVVKVHASQAYATEATGRAWFEAACREAGVEPQYFVSRNDLRCGSTVGPLTAGRLGVAAVDVGSPMLSMHSAREVAAVADHAPMCRALRAFCEMP